LTDKDTHFFILHTINWINNIQIPCHKSHLSGSPYTLYYNTWEFHPYQRLVFDVPT